MTPERDAVHARPGEGGGFSPGLTWSGSPGLPAVRIRQQGTPKHRMRQLMYKRLDKGMVAELYIQLDLMHPRGNYNLHYNISKKMIQYNR